jgi:hypothetical protein
VLDALSVPVRPRSPLQLGLANLPNLAPAEAMAALEQYRNALAARLEEVEKKQQRQQPLPYFVDAMFEHSMVMIKAELGWLQRFMAELEEEHVQD